MVRHIPSSHFEMTSASGARLIQLAGQKLEWLGGIFSDRLILFLVMVIAAATGMMFINSGEIAPQFYQGRFAPAIAVACGDQATASGDAAAQALNDFLALKRQSITCSEVPAAILSSPLTLFQITSRYLMDSVGLLWRLTGVDWGALQYLYSALYACMIAFTYGLLRLGANRLVAMITVMVLTFSPLQLDTLPHLRDFSKAPFIVATILFLAWMVKYPLRLKQLATLAGLTGMTLGMGLGFRMDLLIFVPLVPMVLFLFLPGGFRQNLSAKVMALATFLIAFLLTGWPLLRAIAGGNTFHVILLGLMSSFDPALKVIPSIYEWGYLYTDSYISDVVNSYAHRAMGATQPLEMATPEYNHACLAYYLDIHANFPADIALRFGAAVAVVLGIAKPGAYWSMSIVPWLTLGTLVGLAAFGLRRAFFAYLLILFLCGYPALQFDVRHYFHLQIVPLWILALLASAAMAWGGSIIRGLVYGVPLIVQQPPGTIKRRVRDILIFALCAIIIPSLALVGLRAWQINHLQAMFSYFDALPAKPINLQRVEEEESITFYVGATDSLAERGEKNLYPIETGYWVAEFDSCRCENDVVTLKIQYESPIPFNKFSRNVSLQISPRAKYFFATYSSYSDISEISTFSGIALDKLTANCLIRLSRIADLGNIRLLPNLLLTENWGAETLYQQYSTAYHNYSIKGWRGDLGHYTDSDVPVAKATRILEALPPLAIEAETWVGRGVTPTETGLSVVGPPEARYTYLVQLPRTEVRSPRYLVASGILRRGGLTIGGIDDNRWISQVNITEAGKFTVAMKLNKTIAIPTIASNLPVGENSNDFEIHKFGWSESDDASTVPGSLQ